MAQNSYTSIVQIDQQTVRRSSSLQLAPVSFGFDDDGMVSARSSVSRRKRKFGASTEPFSAVNRHFFATAITTYS